MAEESERATISESAGNGIEGAAAVSLISVLIVNYNGATLLRDCLQSLRALTYPRYEVIVVDNASTDESLAVLAEFALAHVVRSERNRGFAGGNNFGLGHCRGDYVLLLNNDTRISPSLLTELSAHLQQHPETGIVQGKMILPRFQNHLEVCGSFLTRLGLPYHYGYYKPDGPQYQRSYPVFSGKGACLMFRRELIDAVGGFLFDEGFFCYYEETDFCHRAWLAGYETHFVPTAPVEHWMGATARQHANPGFVLRYYLRNMAFSLSANLSAASRWRILPFYFATLFAGVLASAGCGKWSQCRAHLGVFSHYLRQARAIRHRRALIRRIRKQTDHDIFRKVLRNPRWDYFLKTFTGQLGDYVDQKLER